MAGKYKMNHFFIHKDKLYGRNTLIKIKQSYIDTHLYDGLPIWPHARFEKSVTKNNVLYYYFTICNLDSRGQWQKCVGYFLMNANEIDDAIEEITRANEIQASDIDVLQAKADWEVDGMGAAWATYLATLAGSLIFKEFYLLWGVASYVFFKYRKEKLNR